MTEHGATVGSAHDARSGSELVGHDRRNPDGVIVGSGQRRGEILLLLVLLLLLLGNVVVLGLLLLLLLLLGLLWRKVVVGRLWNHAIVAGGGGSSVVVSGLQLVLMRENGSRVKESRRLAGASEEGIQALRWGCKGHLGLGVWVAVHPERH